MHCAVFNQSSSSTFTCMLSWSLWCRRLVIRLVVVEM
uniref:Uncharacterized protein n=1 Tax=Rhizophora mucronata TaxID=61149 RepID=A0A2P2NY32_RHIMU